MAECNKGARTVLVHGKVRLRRLLQRVSLLSNAVLNEFKVEDPVQTRSAALGL